MLFVVLAALAALPLQGSVRADGEAGLVIQQGGDVQTYCIAFEGDSISGEALLRAAGRSFGQFGGGARVLCSLDDIGCDDASSFESCFCQCKAGSGSCTYWAFFTQRYAAAWAYSTVGFNLARAGDGDLHGWKWGEGGAQSAPAPAAITFEDVCGHPPRGGASVATPTSTTTPTPTPTPARGSPGPGSPTSSSSASPPMVPSTSPSGPAASATPASVQTATVRPSVAPSSSSAIAPTFESSVTITIGGRSPTPVPSGAAPPVNGDGGGSNTSSIVAFAAVAGALVAAIAGALIWRSRRDH
ncbi:MAG: hypothetical protein AB7T37_04515 [Dehalococcoidia bacterium]